MYHSSYVARAPKGGHALHVRTRTLPDPAHWRHRHVYDVARTEVGAHI
jgi:hypothetical protein